MTIDESEDYRTIYGTDTHEYLSGSEKNEYLFGGGGNDLLFGHVGNDIYHGGPGHDTFALHGNLDGGYTNILDFNVARDSLILVLASLDDWHEALSNAEQVISNNNGKPHILTTVEMEDATFHFHNVLLDALWDADIINFNPIS